MAQIKLGFSILNDFDGQVENKIREALKPAQELGFIGEIKFFGFLLEPEKLEGINSLFVKNYIAERLNAQNFDQFMAEDAVIAHNNIKPTEFTLFSLLNFVCSNLQS